MNAKVKSLLFSLTTAFTLFLLLAVIFGYGSHIANFPEIKPVFKEMTSIHIWSSVYAILHNPTLLLWLLVLVAVAAALFINTMCCTSRQINQCLGRSVAASGKSRLQTMAFIHVVALVVILFHGLDVALVQRHEPVKIAEGEKSAELGSYTVRVDSINYSTDKSFIQENEQGRRLPSFKIPRKEFSVKDNRAQISLYRDGNLVREADIALFAPVRLGSTFFILDGFYIPHGSEQIGIALHNSSNPLVIPFFAIYTILFSALLWHAFRNRYQPEAGGGDHRVD